MLVWIKALLSLSVLCGKLLSRGSTPLVFVLEGKDQSKVPRTLALVPLEGPNCGSRKRAALGDPSPTTVLVSYAVKHATSYLFSSRHTMRGLYV